MQELEKRQESILQQLEALKLDVAKLKEGSQSIPLNKVQKLRKIKIQTFSGLILHAAQGCHPGKT